MNFNLQAVAVVVSLVLGSSAYGANFVRVTDASLIKFQTDGSRIYLRNVRDFDGNALGCCYNYYIDTQTAEGKLIWTLIMTLSAQGKGLWIRVPDGYAPGPVTMAGEW